MKNQTLRNKRGEVIGSLQVTGRTVWLMNRKGTRLGYYDTSTNNTFDAKGRLVAANSNILVMLLSETL